MLKSIAVLRTFGFSIAHIKSIIETPDVINSIVEEIHDRKSKIVKEEQEHMMKKTVLSGMFVAAALKMVLTSLIIWIWTGDYIKTERYQ